ncbi:MAG: AAA family ATPase [Desulfobacterales bacterium]|nr:AAA family ATPase [Desulfobacterales bacterium]
MIQDNTMGEIITFYSYKGGVGRTMTLANIGVLLSQWGYKVLMVDWDIEAPGLEYFFETHIDNWEDAVQTEGIVDLLTDAYTSQQPQSKKWQDFLIEIALPNDTDYLHLLKAGKTDENYFGKVRKLDWQIFYNEKQGGYYVEKLRNEWKQEYDFILIDSRTGVTDIGGICTIQLPDIMMLMFTAMKQSLDGIINIAKKADIERQKLPFDRFSLISVPIPLRFDASVEFKISKDWLNRFAEQLKDIYANWLPARIAMRDFLEITKVPYIPYFSFGEKLAVLEQGTSDPAGLGYAVETISSLLANQLESAEQLTDNRDEYVRLASIIKLHEEKREIAVNLKEDLDVIINNIKEDISRDNQLVKDSFNALSQVLRLLDGTQLKNKFSEKTENAKIIAKLEEEIQKAEDIKTKYSNILKKYDLLIIDDQKWLDIIISTFEDIYKCDKATTYDSAAEKIEAGYYRVICINREIGSVVKGHKLLAMLRDEHPKISVVLITWSFGGDFSTVQKNIHNIQTRFPNIKDVIFKDAQHFESDFVNDLLNVVSKLIADQRNNMISKDKRNISENSIRMLHLSDLHITSDIDPISIYQPLFSDLEDKEEGFETKKLDYLIITGDLTSRAAPEEFEKAAEFINVLKDHYKLPDDRCIIVPGNHDLSWAERVYDWKDKDELHEEKVEYIPQGDGFLIPKDNYPDRFKNFSEYLYRLITQNAYPLNFEDQCIPFLFADHRILVLAMNSSWRIDKYFKERSGINDSALSKGLLEADKMIDDAKATGILDNDASVLKIAIWHHPVTGNEKIKSDAFLERLRQYDFKLCLHGHIHEERADIVGYIHPTRKIRIVGAGSFDAPGSDRPESIPRLYNLIEISPDHRLIRVNTRCKRKDTGAWTGYAVWPGKDRHSKQAYYEIDLQ